MKVLICDDEPLARKRLLRIAEALPDTQVVGEAENGAEAIQQTSQLHPDVILLDIRMPEMDGLEVAGHLAALDHPPAIIFTTAFDSHALAAFKTEAVDYLLKPIRKEHLQTALQKAKKLNRAQLAQLRQQPPASRSHISAHIGSELKLIPLADIYYFHAEQKYVTVCHKGGETLIEEPLKDLEQEFADRFIRIHRSTLVARNHIAGMRRDEARHYQITLTGSSATLEVSRRHASAVKGILKGG